MSSICFNVASSCIHCSFLSLLLLYLYTQFVIIFCILIFTLSLSHSFPFVTLRNVEVSFLDCCIYLKFVAAAFLSALSLSMPDRLPAFTLLFIYDIYTQAIRMQIKLYTIYKLVCVCVCVFDTVSLSLALIRGPQSSILAKLVFVVAANWVRGVRVH